MDFLGCEGMDGEEIGFDAEGGVMVGVIEIIDVTFVGNGYAAILFFHSFNIPEKLSQSSGMIFKSKVRIN
jgi:hypothetical protein